jgi:hypothetical protein
MRNAVLPPRPPQQPVDLVAHAGFRESAISSLLPDARGAAPAAGSRITSRRSGFVDLKVGMIERDGNAGVRAFVAIRDQINARGVSPSAAERLGRAGRSKVGFVATEPRRTPALRESAQKERRGLSREWEAL